MVDIGLLFTGADKVKACIAFTCDLALTNFIFLKPYVLCL